MTGNGNEGDMSTTQPNDRDEIVQLMHRYCRALDYGLHDEWRDVFTTDAEYTTNLPDGSVYARLTTPKEFADFLDAYPRAPAAFPKHVTINPVVVVDGDRATGDSGFLYLSGTADMSAIGITAFGRYRDVFHNEGGHWRIAERVCDTEATAGL